ncbi:MAG TPA: RNA polymerase sigma factor [Methyloceanibacter sp.]|nr:RNA polymerase sigma factor [Methyloceanibacter sp.]
MAVKTGHSPSAGSDAIEPASVAPLQVLQDAPIAPAGILDSDGELVERACAADRAAFETLLRRHYDRIHRIAWRMTGSATDADDIAQDVCCTLVEKIDSFKGEAKFTTWLSGIVVNACRDHHRRRATLTKFRNDLTVMTNLTGGSGEDAIHDRVWLASAIARLDPPLRDAVILVVGEDMSHAEAGAALGVAESTISWRLHQVRRLMAGKTEQGGQDGP